MIKYISNFVIYIYFWKNNILHIRLFKKKKKKKKKNKKKKKKKTPKIN